MTRSAFTSLMAGALLLAPAAAQAGLMPYLSGTAASGSLEEAVAATKTKLTEAGLEVVGDYGPFTGAHVIAVTHPALKAAAGKSEHGGFGAVARVGLTKMGDKIQVAYTNPPYWAAAFRMKGSVSAVTAALSKALGKGKAFGHDEGFSDEDLRDYHYMISMPYFDDFEEIGSFSSQAAGVAKVEKNLKAGKGKTTFVYRVDLGKSTLFGVGISAGKGGDPLIMRIIDKANPRHTAHLPYELLVEGGKAYMLHGKFRIAIAFPELTMGTFMKISDAPDAIIEAMTAACK